MNSFAEFRESVGMTIEEVEEATGYTRQGLDKAFKNLSKGKTSKKFLICITRAIEWQENYENLLHDARMRNLSKLKNDIEFMGSVNKIDGEELDNGKNND